MATLTVHADLVFDPNDVGPDCVVECRISHGPRADESSFDPRPGDRVTLVDEDRETLRGRVTNRDGNRVWVQVEIPGLLLDGDAALAFVRERYELSEGDISRGIPLGVQIP